MNGKYLRFARAATCAVAMLWAGSALAAPLLAAPAPAAVGEEARIPQAAVRITNWVLDGNRGIWVEATGHSWYYGEFLSPCYGIGAGDTVAFRFGPDGSLDRFSRVIAPRPRHQSCAFSSFLTSAPPPAEKASVPRTFRSR